MESSVDTHRHGAGRRRDNRERLRQLYGTAQGLRGSRACQVGSIRNINSELQRKAINVFLVYFMYSENYAASVSISKFMCL